MPVTNPLAAKVVAILHAAQQRGYTPEQAKEMAYDELRRHSTGDVVLAEDALAKAINRT